MREKEAGKRLQQQLSYPRGPPPFPPPCCPRCSSGNTKFCYYNNYSASQPRYICKECRRYWTHGGVVRNISSTRKRGRVNYSSSSAHISKPPPSGLPAAWSMGSSSHNAAGVGSRSSVSCDTFRPPVTESMQSFNVGGVYNQPTLKYSPSGELGGLNSAFGAVSAGLSGAAPLTPMLPHHSLLDGFNDFGYSFLQQPQFQPPPTLWTSQSMGRNSSSSQQHGSWNPTAAANVVSIHEWPALNDMDTEGDPLQCYKPPSP